MVYKILFLISGLIGIGLPFDTVWHYGYAFLITFVLIYGAKRNVVQIKHLIFGAFLLLATAFIPKIEIIEQQRLLVENGKIVSPKQFIDNINSYPFSQTADGYLQGLGLSRKVRDISLLNTPRHLRSGYVNRVEYNFYGPPQALIRECLPFVACYKITESIVKRGLQAQGTFYFNNHFFMHPVRKNIILEDKDLGTYFYAFGADCHPAPSEATPHLILNLNTSLQDNLCLLGEVLLKIFGLLLVAYGFFDISRKSLDWREILILLSWNAYFLICFKQFLWEEIFACGGCDGIVHGGHPYVMLEALARGDWLTAIKSPEAIFYYMPGMRYIRFLEMLIFGDAYPLQLTVLLFTPVLYYRFFKELLPPKYALIICVLMGTSILKFLGIDFHIHLHSFFALYGEGFAYSCLTGGLLLLLRGISSRGMGIGCFSLFAIALSIRPNLGMFIGCLILIYFFLSTFSSEDKKYKFIDLLGMSPLILIPLHNIYFGHSCVLLTSASGIPENLPLTPKMYWDAIQCLGGLIAPFKSQEKFMHHFNYQGLFVLLFMATNFKIALRSGLKNRIGALAFACMLGLSVHLFYLAKIRYMQPYFLVSIILILANYKLMGLRKKA